MADAADDELLFGLVKRGIGENRNPVYTCTACNKHFKGAQNRVTAHLLRLTGFGVSQCTRTLTRQKREEIQQAHDKLVSKAAAAAAAAAAPSNAVLAVEEAAGIGAGTAHGAPSSQRGAGGGGGGRVAGRAATASNTRQLTYNETVGNQQRKAADLATAMCFYACGIPFNVARSPFFKRMMAQAANAGPSWTPPGSEKLRTTL